VEVAMRGWIVMVALQAGWAQTAAFDVASVKLTSHGRTADGWSRSSIEVASPGRFVATNASMEECVRWAYNVNAYQIAGPTWLNTDEASYDIEAKAPPETTKGQTREMLQKLLAERFRLALHREERMLPVYELVVVSKGAKLQAAVEDGHNSTRSVGGHVTAHGVSMQEWAYQLSRYTKAPVFDKTGIAGNFDFKLDYQVEGSDEPLPSLFTALQDQLGLKLQSAKAPIEVLVIEHVERIPSGN
jgi:uncharacterized protein (TIGR03435 family)